MDKNEEIYVTIGAGCGLTFFGLVFIFLLVFIIKKWQIWQKRAQIINSLNMNHQIIERNCLDLGEIIGEGNFGCVYRASLKIDGNNTEVAVKTVKDGCDKSFIESCLNEGILLINFNHERILTPIGVCFKETGIPLIILPLMENGDLFQYLRGKDVLLTVKQLIHFAHQIAEGMVYLSSKHFVHRDLAARNCLLDENLSAKIGDFGLSRDIYSKHYYRSKNNISLPYKWMAPESIEKGFYDTQTDVWSFGVLFWEILSRGSDPYPTVDNADILHYIKSNQRLPKPTPCSDVIYKLLSQCWSIEPKFRPHFAYIFDFISIIIDDSDENIVNCGEMSSGPSYVTHPLFSTFLQ